ncbi:hypothetical protein JOM56_009187 [Amanita muscaria]
MFPTWSALPILSVQVCGTAVNTGTENASRYVSSWALSERQSVWPVRSIEANVIEWELRSSALLQCEIICRIFGAWMKMMGVVNGKQGLLHFCEGFPRGSLEMNDFPVTVCSEHHFYTRVDDEAVEEAYCTKKRSNNRGTVEKRLLTLALECKVLFPSSDSSWYQNRKAV